MTKIDTHMWKKFIIGDLFEKLQLDIRNKDFNKSLDVSEEQTDEFNLPLINAKHGNNGIMYYGREGDFDTAEMSIDIVQNGAIATGDVYAQPQKTGVLWDAYLVKPKADITSTSVLIFLATVLERTIKKKFSYDDKCIWDKAKQLPVMLPCTKTGEPDWFCMESHMTEVLQKTYGDFEVLQQVKDAKRTIDVSEWQEFAIKDLFPNIVKPAVLHTRQVVEDVRGIPYVVRTKFDNGIRYRVQPVDGVEPSPAGVITWGAENATFFYQPEPFLSGRDIYYIDTREYSSKICLFLASCLQTVTHKYPYNFGLFPELLREERIKLPVTKERSPDWAYMDAYMSEVMRETEYNFNALQQVNNWMSIVATI